MGESPIWHRPTAQRVEPVYGAGGGNDQLPMVMQGFDQRADHVQLAAMAQSELDVLLHRRRDPVVSHLEPAVPYRSTHWEDFQADSPFDFICLTRSPPYTPVTADPLYDEIRAAFVEEITLTTYVDDHEKSRSAINRIRAADLTR